MDYMGFDIRVSNAEYRIFSPHPKGRGRWVLLHYQATYIKGTDKNLLGLQVYSFANDAEALAHAKAWIDKNFHNNTTKTA